MVFANEAANIFVLSAEIPCEWMFATLVSQCSAALASAAAQPPGARQGFGGPNYPRHPRWWQCYTPLPRARVSLTGGCGMGCDRALRGGGGG